MPYRKITQSVMGLVYSIPKSETMDGVARELGARTRLCLKRKVSNTRAAEGVGPYNVQCVISELGVNSNYRVGMRSYM